MSKVTIDGTNGFEKSADEFYEYTKSYYLALLAFHERNGTPPIELIKGHILHKLYKMDTEFQKAFGRSLRGHQVWAFVMGISDTTGRGLIDYAKTSEWDKVASTVGELVEFELAYDESCSKLCARMRSLCEQGGCSIQMNKATTLRF